MSLYKIKISGTTPIIMHNGSTGIDTRDPRNIEKTELTRKKGSNRTATDEARIRGTRMLSCAVARFQRETDNTHSGVPLLSRNRSSEAQAGAASPRRSRSCLRRFVRVRREGVRQDGGRACGKGSIHVRGRSPAQSDTPDARDVQHPLGGDVHAGCRS